MQIHLIAKMFDLLQTASEVWLERKNFVRALLNPQPVHRPSGPDNTDTGRAGILVKALETVVDRGPVVDSRGPTTLKAHCVVTSFTSSS